jgi:hypothetical protein
MTSILESLEINIKNNDIRKLIDIIISDNKFIVRIEEYIKNVLKDGQVDYKDIPDLIAMIMDVYESVKDTNLITLEELPEFIQLLFNIIIKKYNLVSEDKREPINTMLLSIIKLVILVPKSKYVYCSSLCCINNK